MKYCVNMSCCYLRGCSHHHTYIPKAVRASPNRSFSIDPASFSTDLHSTPTISMFNGAPLWHCPLPHLRFLCHGLVLYTSTWNGGGPSCLESGSSPWERPLGGHSGETNGSCQVHSPKGSLLPDLPSPSHPISTLTPREKHTCRWKVWISDFSTSKVNFPKNTSVLSSTWRPW